ncbi:MAG TPA: hypothetical protein VLO07_04240, partial [Thermoanaerobaculia bacterium]|nr:hypothetical protein [Thermoanaerobaculia bacterium]
RHLGLEATRAIGRILVDPRNPDILLVAALGHIFGPNPERGVFRSEDGGKTWRKTLFVNEDTGAVDLASDPEDPAVVYAAAWQVRNFPWLSYFLPGVGTGSGLYKSADGGKSWKRQTGGGWPSGELGRIGLAAASGGRVYALVDARPYLATLQSAKEEGSSAAGLYRSDDAGASWRHVNSDAEFASSYFGRLTVEPGSRDAVTLMGQSVRQSDDGGKTFRIVKGAPGGDDYHFLWINPKHPDHRVLTSDQGTVVTVNGGRTWSTWFNQPTGQFYHVATDDRFPYWIYSGQQDSGTVGIASRCNDGLLTFREWHPVGADERGWDIPDPEDPNLVYGSGLGGSLTRYDARTGQVEDISPLPESTYAQRPTGLKYRYTWITPLAVSRKPPHAIYFGSQHLLRSTDRGHHWEVASPDLSGAVPGTKGCEGDITLANAGPCGFGVIYSLSLSPRDDLEIWAGTDDGLIHVTRDGGKTWRNVTPPGLPIWSKIAGLDASPLAAGTAYAAVDAQRLDDFTPHAYRTRDSGRSWTAITSGLPVPGYVSVVRADPVRRGLLYAGTDTGVFVSFDDGDHWQSLKLNLPTAWVRDLTVHDGDLVAATQGRAIWVLDDVTPLRQITGEVAGAPAYLFRPAPAIRVRRDENRDTPLPPETPAGQNPPAGAVIDYTLNADERGPVTLEILDANGGLVRRYSSADAPEKLNADRYFGEDWLTHERPLSGAAGHHRFFWDLRFTRPRAERYEFTIAAVYGEGTGVRPEGPLAPPGEYTARLTAGGRGLAQPLSLKMDARVKTPEAQLRQQSELAIRIAQLMDRDFETLEQVRTLRRELQKRKERVREGALAGEIAALEAKAAALESQSEGAGTPTAGAQSLTRLSRRLGTLLNVVDGADAAPTAQATAAFEDIEKALGEAVSRWSEIQSRDLPSLDAKLRGAGLEPLSPK